MMWPGNSAPINFRFIFRRSNRNIRNRTNLDIIKSGNYDLKCCKGFAENSITGTNAKQTDATNIYKENKYFKQS